MSNSIVIAAGGTGGHISPGIALAEILVNKKEEFKLNEIYIHSLKRNKDNPDLVESPCKVIWHNTPQFSKNPFLFPFKFLFALVKTIFEFRKLKIEVVIAMGGYSSLPSIVYAILFKKKIYLCEQNRVIGKVNKKILKFADKIAYSFPIVDSKIGKKLISKVLGNPTRKKILPDIKAVAYKLQTKSPKEKLNILVMGGSQGARQINNMVIQLMNQSNITKNFNFRILTGENLFDEAKSKTEKGAELISYSNEMKTHYEWADLVIARSGAGVISECAIFALPMILIPYPYSTDNHQIENANYFEEHLAAWVLNQKDEDITKLISILNKIIEDRNLLSHKAEKSLTCSRPSAALDTVKFFFSHER